MIPLVGTYPSDTLTDRNRDTPIRMFTVSATGNKPKTEGGRHVHWNKHDPLTKMRRPFDWGWEALHGTL